MIKIRFCLTSTFYTVLYTYVYVTYIISKPEQFKGTGHLWQLSTTNSSHLVYAQHAFKNNKPVKL